MFVRLRLRLRRVAFREKNQAAPRAGLRKRTSIARCQKCQCKCHFHRFHCFLHGSRIGFDEPPEITVQLKVDFKASDILNNSEQGFRASDSPLTRQRLAGGTMPFIRKYSTIWP